MRGQTGELARASAVLTEAVATFDRLDQRNRRLHARMELARVRQRAGEHAAVIPLVEEAVALGRDKEKAFDELFAYDLLAGAYAGLGDYRRAYDYLGRLNAVRGRLDSTNNVREMRELTRRYDLREQRRVIAEQEAALAARRWYEVALGLAVLVVLGLCFALWVVWRRGTKHT